MSKAVDLFSMLHIERNLTRYEMGRAYVVIFTVGFPQGVCNLVASAYGLKPQLSPDRLGFNVRYLVKRQFGWSIWYVTICASNYTTMPPHGCYNLIYRPTRHKQIFQLMTNLYFVPGLYTQY